MKNIDEKFYLVYHYAILFYRLVICNVIDVIKIFNCEIHYIILYIYNSIRLNQSFVINCTDVNVIFRVESQSKAIKSKVEK